MLQVDDVDEKRLSLILNYFTNYRQCTKINTTKWLAYSLGCSTRINFMSVTFWLFFNILNFIEKKCLQFCWWYDYIQLLRWFAKHFGKTVLVTFLLVLLFSEKVETKKIYFTELSEECVEYNNINPFHATGFFPYPLKTSENP